MIAKLNELELTITVKGKRGTGKTRLLALLQQALKDDPYAIITKFELSYADEQTTEINTITIQHAVSQ